MEWEKQNSLNQVEFKFGHNFGIPYAPYSFRVRIRIRIMIKVKIRGYG